MRNPISFLLSLLLLWAHPASIGAQEVEDEREFDYVEGSNKGPSHWGDLKSEWAACKNGTMQSPIDVANRIVQVKRELGELKISYRPSNATLKNRGHDIEVKWEGNAGSMEINGTKFFLQQCHWHSPSEHTIDGTRYDMELHMVHATQYPAMKNTTAVVALLYKIGQPDPFLAKLEGYIRSIADQEREMNLGVVNPPDIKRSGEEYYRYTGSLTTPPCTEGVIWTIKKKINTVSRKQVKLLREAVHDSAESNARPLQPLNKRDVYLWLPSH